MQVVAREQSMAVSCAPAGIDVVGCHVVRFVELREVAPPPDATPIATHDVADEQDTDESRFTEGSLRIVQVVPS